MEPVVGYGYYYALLVCYDGYDPDKFYHQQPEDVYDLFELWSIMKTMSLCKVVSEG